jgi:hypothetical protein
MPHRELYSQVPSALNSYVWAQIPTCTWMPRPKRLKRAGKKKLEKHNKFVDKLKELLDTDLETNMALAMTQSYSYKAHFIDAAKDLIKNKVKQTYENV